ncbi:MAG: hypothetical protein HY738_15225 [Bacteroidia bacterium]|nr:hypothetical protein [Bacteroidia bacterium]
MINELEKAYISIFEKALSLDNFKKIYGTDDNTYRKCDYCEITERDIQRLADADNIMTKHLFSRGRSMEIDRKDSFADYSKDNIVLCCYWCNNAKTDEFSYDEFKFVGKSFKQVWLSRLEKIDK